MHILQLVVNINFNKLVKNQKKAIMFCKNCWNPSPN